MVINQFCTQSRILSFSRWELSQKVKLRLGDSLTEEHILFELQKKIDNLILEVESEASGAYQIVSLSISPYTLGNDIRYLVTMLYGR